MKKHTVLCIFNIKGLETKSVDSKRFVFKRQTHNLSISQALIREHYLDHRNLNKSIVPFMSTTSLSVRPGRNDAVTWHLIYKVLWTSW